MARSALRAAVAVVPVGSVAGARAEDLARRLAAEGAGVVLVAGEGEDAASAGALASRLEATGGRRPAVYTVPSEADAASLDGLVELLGELFG